MGSSLQPVASNLIPWVCCMRYHAQRGQAATELREAYGVRPACWRFRSPYDRPKAGASSTHSIRFATFHAGAFARRNRPARFQQIMNNTSTSAVTQPRLAGDVSIRHPLGYTPRRWASLAVLSVFTSLASGAEGTDSFKLIRICFLARPLVWRARLYLALRG